MLFCCLFASACLALEDPPGEDLPEGSYVLPRNAAPLQIYDYAPIDSLLTTRYPPLWFGFDQYLDPALILFHDTLSLTSGGVSFTVRAHYDMLNKRIVGRLTRPLEPGLAYTFTLKPDNIKTLYGAVLEFKPIVEFKVAADSPDPQEPSPEYTPTWSQDIAPIFEASCAPCHTPSEVGDTRTFDIPDLSYASLVQKPSQQRASQLLVRPLEPGRSYLMHKILADYPVRRGSAMPPPWTTSARSPSGQPVAYKPLTQEELRLIELWIFAGALP